MPLFTDDDENFFLSVEFSINLQRGNLISLRRRLALYDVVMMMIMQIWQIIKLSISKYIHKRTILELKSQPMRSDLRTHSTSTPQSRKSVCYSTVIYSWEIVFQHNNWSAIKSRNVCFFYRDNCSLVRVAPVVLLLRFTGSWLH